MIPRGLRRLVETAQKTGNLPSFDEATRALYAGDQARREQLIAGWPDDLRAHVRS